MQTIHYKGHRKRRGDTGDAQQAIKAEHPILSTLVKTRTCILQWNMQIN